MKKKYEKRCGICDKKMKLTNSQKKQKEICDKCSTELNKARAERSYHRLKNARRFIYWHNIIKAIEATRKGVKL